MEMEPSSVLSERRLDCKVSMLNTVPQSLLGISWEFSSNSMSFLPFELQKDKPRQNLVILYLKLLNEPAHEIMLLLT